MRTTIPAAAVAGTFYPADPEQLNAAVRKLLSAASVPDACSPRAIIAPHAGYDYSGPVAGSAYAATQLVRDRIGRVVLLGTCHVPGVRGLATTSADAMTTPLGDIPVDRAAIDGLLPEAQDVVVHEAAHAIDHSLQVQLPFLQIAFKQFAVAPFLVGQTDTAAVAAVIAALASDDTTLVVVSSDLSHYHDYETARQIDRQTADAIVHLDGKHLGRDQACGFRAIRGLLSVAKHRGWTARLVDLRNSGDREGRRDRVVGYGAFVFGG